MSVAKPWKCERGVPDGAAEDARALGLPASGFTKSEMDTARRRTLSRLHPDRGATNDEAFKSASNSASALEEACTSRPYVPDLVVEELEDGVLSVSVQGEAFILRDVDKLIMAVAQIPLYEEGESFIGGPVRFGPFEQAVLTDEEKCGLALAKLHEELATAEYEATVPVRKALKKRAWVLGTLLVTLMMTSVGSLVHKGILVDHLDAEAALAEPADAVMALRAARVNELRYAIDRSRICAESARLDLTMDTIIENTQHRENLPWNRGPKVLSNAHPGERNDLKEWWKSAPEGGNSCHKLANLPPASLGNVSFPAHPRDLPPVYLPWLNLIIGTAAAAGTIVFKEIATMPKNVTMKDLNDKYKTKVDKKRTDVLESLEKRLKADGHVLTVVTSPNRTVAIRMMVNSEYALALEKCFGLIKHASVDATG